MEKDITVILNCYKRPHLLLEQIESMKRQSIVPAEIMVWVNKDERYDYRAFEMDGIKIFNCNHNWKFYGRFASALLADTEFIAIFDDDTMPGHRWFENCLQTMERKEGILGGIGCILPEKGYRGHQRIGWSALNEDIVEVDLVGHAWFFKREWLQYLWREKPQMWENGEDIQFSYMAQKYGGIKTYVPPHRKGVPATYSSLKGMEYGIDDVATSNQRNHKEFYEQRDQLVNSAVKGGWKLVRGKV